MLERSGRKLGSYRCLSDDASTFTAISRMQSTFTRRSKALDVSAGWQRWQRCGWGLKGHDAAIAALPGAGRREGGPLGEEWKV